MFTYSHKYYATNARGCTRSPTFDDCHKAIEWAATEAADKGYHSKVHCLATTHRADGTAIETVTTEIGAVRAGERTMLERRNSKTVGYPTW